MKVQSDISAGIVFIVDDEETARISLQRFLKSYGYETEIFASAEEFLERSMHRGIGCLILDFQMPKMTGLELQQELASRGYEIPVIFLTAQGDIGTSVTAMKNGAEDFLPKMADEEQLLEAVDCALQRSVEAIEVRKRSEHAEACAASLTERELEVCRYVISGLLNKQIAAKLGISERTVKAHRAKVMRKFKVESVAELVRLTAKANISVV